MHKLDHNCNSCEQADRCRQVYMRLGQDDMPAIGRQVVFAFLLPLIGLFGGWVFTDWLFSASGWPISQAIGLMIGLIVGGCCVLIGRMALKRACKLKGRC